MISYYSTNRHAPQVALDQALLQGQAPDRGLYMPTHIPPIATEVRKNMHRLSYPDLAVRLLSPYAQGVFSDDELGDICHDAYNFDVPVEHVCDNRHLLRLDRGPTASFKDFAARFMGRALGRLVARQGRELLILTATSGDTGSAVAHAFSGVPTIRVLVLFPIDEVSDRQRKQMTTLGGNVATVAVDGKFDDCQALVKRAFSDADLQGLNLSSANSINIGRLLPQSVYYAYAAAQVSDVASGEPVVVCIPSGNFGNLMGGMLARQSGLPVARFIAATNINDEVPRFLASGQYQKIEPSLAAISNAMNVGHPSNLARLVDLYGGHIDERGAMLQQPDMERLREVVFGISIDDAQTRQTIRDVYAAHNALLEPHGAVGWAGLDAFLNTEEGAAFHKTPCVSLETAHPAKFPDEIVALLGISPDLPRSLQGLEELPESYGNMSTDYAAFKALLQREYAG